MSIIDNNNTINERKSNNNITIIIDDDHVEGQISTQSSRSLPSTPKEKIKKNLSKPDENIKEKHKNAKRKVITYSSIQQ